MSAGNARWSLDLNRNAERSGGASGANRRSECDAVIGAQSKMVGRFEFGGGAELSCEMEGEIYSFGDLIIGETGDVRATIQAESLKVFGRIEGDIVCRDRLEAFAGARIKGNIISPRVVMHDGVVFEGECTMDEAAVAEALKS